MWTLCPRFLMTTLEQPPSNTVLSQPPPAPNTARAQSSKFWSLLTTLWATSCRQTQSFEIPIEKKEGLSKVPLCPHLVEFNLKIGGVSIT
jgi:hypothetical protein